MHVTRMAWGNIPQATAGRDCGPNNVNPCYTAPKPMSAGMARLMQKTAYVSSMNAKLIKNCGLAATLFVAGFSWSAAEAAPSPAAPAKAAASVAAKSGADNLQKAKAQFEAGRDKFLSDRQKMLDQLKTATEEQKKVIIEKMEEQKKAMAEASRELAKQAREDARKQRQTGTPPGR